MIPRTMGVRFLHIAAALVAGAIGPDAAIGQARPAGIEGTWDLIWQTRHGPEQNGYLLLRFEGGQLVGEIHGRGAVTARGSMSGQDFHLGGSRMLVPYRIDGRLSGDRIAGRLRMLSVDRRFQGVRRAR